MANLKDDLSKIDKIKGDFSKGEFSIFGYKLTPTQIGIAFAALSTVMGTLYGGFVTYQKVEAIAEIDPAAIFSELEKVNTRIDESEKDLKGIKEDIKRAEGTADDAYRFVKDVNKEMNDELRSFRKDVKEIETTFTTKLQRALDNPLSDM